MEKIHVISIKVDITLEEKIRVLERDDDLILPLKFQNTSSGILVGNEVIPLYLEIDIKILQNNL